VAALTVSEVPAYQPAQRQPGLVERLSGRDRRRARRRDDAQEQSYFAAVTDLARSDSMGSVHWAGLKTGDSYSMEAHSGSGLSNNNASGATQVRWGWGY